MDKYMVYYQKIPHDSEHMFDEKTVVEADIPDKYAYMGTIEAKNLDHVFAIMNSDNSPLASFEGQKLVEMGGTGHTSMSVNDLIFDMKTQTIYQVKSMGFRVVGIF